MVHIVLGCYFLGYLIYFERTETLAAEILFSSVKYGRIFALGAFLVYSINFNWHDGFLGPNSSKIQVVKFSLQLVYLQQILDQKSNVINNARKI